MPVSLSRELRKTLADVTSAARTIAESAARAALENLAVHERQARGHMDEPKRKLRAALRARGKALGDSRAADGTQELTHLTEHVAYEQWHRLLFTRFLTENHLLLMPDDAGGAPTSVTVEECEELAPELGAKDGFDLACRFASKTLPGVFRVDDPALELAFAPENQVALRRLLDGLSTEVFTADDALGWTYQFWQAQRKDEVNKSGKKIGAAELSPVTQLFTEDYMVEFLLHNTLGAWWAGKVLGRDGSPQPSVFASEGEVRAAVSLPAKNGAPAIDWTYLRFVRSDDPSVPSVSSVVKSAWVPAAGVFSGWPKTTREITLLDPCMGSGHFLVFALPLLVRLRVEEENLSAAAAVAAVLRDNIHGLELDERCTQIAAFNLALAAWKLGGYQALPALHLACSGLAPHTTQAEWVALAGVDEKLQRGMARLYRLFEDAPALGSLINPRATGGDLLIAGFDELRPLVEKVLAPATADDTTRELAVTARGLAKAAELLAGQFTLVATNVPYLGRPKQDEPLLSYCDSFHHSARADLATCFIERSVQFSAPAGTCSLVVPQTWLSIGRYKDFRLEILTAQKIDIVGRLGAKAFQTPMWDFNTALFVASRKKGPSVADSFVGIDVSRQSSALGKAEAIRCIAINIVPQSIQLVNPDSRITLSQLGTLSLLKMTANAWQGIAPTDAERFRRTFWELPENLPGWVFFQSSFPKTLPYSGREHCLFWEDGCGEMAEVCQEQGTFRGRSAWGKRGVMVTAMAHLPVSIYTGEKFDPNAHAVVPENELDLPAIWAFMQSEEFHDSVRDLDQKVAVTNATIAKVPFDLDEWQGVAAEKFPDGLPKPYSSDPTQWLFSGHPKGSDQPLHVALARLLGYRWPRQTGSSFPDCPALDADGLEFFADTDGIVCLAPINREQPAAARLRHLLAAALGAHDERALIGTAGPKGSKSKTLEDWLRDEAFEQHCDLFHARPFIWHLWDGRKDGFHVLVNYHRLDHGMLEKLTFSYLGEWIRQQAEDAKAEKPGAAARLGAAQALQDKLKAILTGEAPLDIFVRWKPLSQQPLGWHPDLNDGIRQNIRPFLLAGDVGKKGAGLFRVKPLALKESDRGTEPERPRADYPWFWCDEDPGTDPKGGGEFVGTRWNTTHLTLATKRAARS